MKPELSRLRAEIVKIPDGDYHAESWLDDDGRNWERPLKVSVTVRKRGTEITRGPVMRNTTSPI